MKVSPIIILGLFFQFSTFFVSAQTFDFEADFTKGCAPLTVTLTDLSGVVGADIKYSFFDGQAFGDQNTFTYTNPGVYTVVQLVQTSGAATAIEKASYIEVVAPQTPEVELITCAGFGVRINVLDTLYDFVEIDFGDGSLPATLLQSENLVYNYTDATPRTITIAAGFTGGGNANCGTTAFNFTPQPTIQPAEISLAQVVNDNEVEISYTIFPEVSYILEERIGDGTYTEVGELPNDQNTFVLPNRSTIQEIRCYRIIANEVCSGVQIVSNEVCVGDLTLTDAIGTNQVEWPEFPVSAEFEAFRIFIDGTLTEEINTQGITVYNHEDVTCNVEYCYQLEVSYTNGAISRSSEQCLVASSDVTPPSAENLKVTVEEQEVVFTYEIPATAENIRVVNIQRAVNGDDFSSLRNENISSNTLVDANVDVNENSYCYRIVIQDSCNNLSPNSLEVCTVLLSATKGESGNELSWTPFSGFPFGFSYTIEVLDENGDVVRSIENLPRSTTSFIDVEATDPAGFYQYRIKVVADHSTADTAFSNEVIIIGSLELQAPEAFTPNGDGLNDSFYVRGNLLDTYNLRIFNRWGDLIFISEQQEQAWDGTYNGSEAPAGPYSFTVEATDINGNVASLKGLFLLIR